MPAVLGVSLLLEGYSLLVAVRTVTAGAAAAGLPFAEFVRRGMDPTSIAVMMEDGAACAGLLIAGQLTCRCSWPDRMREMSLVAAEYADKGSILKH